MIFCKIVVRYVIYRICFKCLALFFLVFQMHKSIKEMGQTS